MALVQRALSTRAQQRGKGANVTRRQQCPSGLAPLIHARLERFGSIEHDGFWHRHVAHARQDGFNIPQPVLGAELALEGKIAIGVLEQKSPLHDGRGIPRVLIEQVPVTKSGQVHARHDADARALTKRHDKSGMRHIVGGLLAKVRHGPRQPRFVEEIVAINQGHIAPCRGPRAAHTTQTRVSVLNIENRVLRASEQLTTGISHVRRGCGGGLVDDQDDFCRNTVRVGVLLAGKHVSERCVEFDALAMSRHDDGKVDAHCAPASGANRACTSHHEVFIRPLLRAA